MHGKRRLEGLKRAHKLLKFYQSWDEEDHLSKLYGDQPCMEKMRIHTRVPCSCPMCGNPRRHFGSKTMQEKRADLAFNDQIDELDQDAA